MDFGDVDEYRNDDLFKKIKHANQTKQKHREVENEITPNNKYLNYLILSILGSFIISMFSYFNKDLIYRCSKKYRWFVNLDKLIIYLSFMSLVTFYIMIHVQQKIIVNLLLAFTFFQIVWALFSFYRALDKGCDQIFAFVMLIFCLFFVYGACREGEGILIYLFSFILILWNCYLQYYSYKLSEFKFS
jgi:hypothetical protein